MVDNNEVATVFCNLITVWHDTSRILSFQRLLRFSSMESFFFLYNFLLCEATEDGKNQTTHRVELGSVRFFQQSECWLAALQLDFIVAKDMVSD